jgi:O-antigen/teichoic acid export membrane protein
MAFGMRVASAGLGYLIFALAARVTDVAGFNDFALIFAATSLFGPVSALGQDQQMLRVLPVFKEHGQVGYRTAISRAARTVSLGVLIFALLAAAYGWVSLGVPSPSVLWLLAALVVANGATEFLFGADRGSGSILGAVAAREIVWKVVLICPMAVLWLLGLQETPATLALFYLLGLCVSLLFTLSRVLRRWRKAPLSQKGDAAGAATASSSALFVLALVSQAGVQIDTLVLGIASTFEGPELGAYFAAQRLTQILYFLPFGVAMTNAPRIPVAWMRGDVSQILQLSRQVSRGMGTLVLVAAVALTFFGAEALGLFRPEFASYWPVLALLSVSPVIAALSGMNHVVPTMCGGELGYAKWRVGIFLAATAAKIAAASLNSVSAMAAVNILEAAAVAAAGILSTRRLLGRWAL